MSRRLRQLAALSCVLAVMAVLAWGCTSGGGEVTTTIGDVTATSPSVSPTSQGNALIGTQLKATSSTPKEYVDAIAQAKPVVILFYVPGGSDDARVLDSLNALQPSFPSYVFLLYDYKTPDLYGDLSTLLKVNYPPELILVDGTGTIKQVWNGFVDQGTINQSLVNLVKT